LPPALEKALFFTPFPYQMYFPISIYMGRTSGVEMLQGLAIQAGWVVALISGALRLGARVRRYSRWEDRVMLEYGY